MDKTHRKTPLTINFKRVLTKFNGNCKFFWALKENTNMKHTVHTAKIMSYQVLSASIQQTGKGLVDYNRQRERTAGVRTCMAILQYQSRKLHSELFEIVSVTGFSLIFINR